MSSPMGNPVLKALDKAKTQTYHFKAIIIAGMGFFTDAYDLFVIGILLKLLGRIYYYDPTNPTTPGTLSTQVSSAVTGTALCGTLVGQLFFGWAGDKFGRKKVYGLTLILMVISSLGQGLSIGRSSASVISTLCFFRFWLGFGIGGDYPLSATIMSEYSNTKTRGAFVAAVFAMQGLGYLTAATVTIMITTFFEHNYPRGTFISYPKGQGYRSTPYVGADWVWRLVLMFGAIPALLTFYSRSRMPETARYTALIARNQQQAAADMEAVLHTHFDPVGTDTKAPAQYQATQFGLFSRQFVRRHGKQLIGTSVSWFMLDVTFYSQNLYQNQLFTQVGWLKKDKHYSALQQTYANARCQAIIALCGTIPGYWFTVAFIDKIGRKPIQLMGFFMMSVLLFIVAFLLNTLQFEENHLAFISIYALIFFFCNFGPNSTTFIVPAELFPARLRSTCHGISSATGKAGAIVGTFGFVYAAKHIHYRGTFIMLAMTAVIGFVVTLVCIPETKGRSLEDLSGEDADDDAIAGLGNGMKDVGKDVP